MLIPVTYKSSMFPGTGLVTGVGVVDDCGRLKTRLIFGSAVIVLVAVIVGVFVEVIVAVLVVVCVAVFVAELVGV